MSESARKLGLAAGLLAALVATTVEAADTIETWDRRPDLAAWAVYLRGVEALQSRHELKDEADEPVDNHVFAPITMFTLGSYWAIADGHQLLLEADASLASNPAEGEPASDFGGLALGYNLVVNEAIELINQVVVDLPVRGTDSVAAGFSVGFIATIPGAAPEKRGERRRLRLAAALPRAQSLR